MLTVVKLQFVSMRLMFWRRMLIHGARGLVDPHSRNSLRAHDWVVSINTTRPLSLDTTFCDSNLRFYRLGTILRNLEMSPETPSNGCSLTVDCSSRNRAAPLLYAHICTRICNVELTQQWEGGRLAI